MSSVLINSETENVFLLKLCTKQGWLLLSFLLNVLEVLLLPLVFELPLILFMSLSQSSIEQACMESFGFLKKFLLGLFILSLRVGSWLLFGLLFFFSFCFSVIYLTVSSLLVLNVGSSFYIFSSLWDSEDEFSMTSIPDTCMSQF